MLTKFKQFREKKRLKKTYHHIAGTPEIEYWFAGDLTYWFGERITHRSVFATYKRKWRIMSEVKASTSSHELALNTKTNLVERHDHWTQLSTQELELMGYRKCRGLYDNLFWWGVPVYLRLEGLSQFDIRQVNERGELIYSQDTATTLHDVMTGNAVADFIKGLARGQPANMDIQKIIAIVIIGVGAVFGMHILGVF